MSIDYAKEHLEHTAHEHPAPPSFSRLAAVIIAVLAAILAIAEFGAKDAQTAFLADHIAASDIWAEYQAKSVRRAAYMNTADTLASLPNAADPAVQARAQAARANAERMQSEPGRGGMKELDAKAQRFEHDRDHASHRYHGLEIATGLLQLAIVLASVSVVTGLMPVLIVGCLLGAGSAVYALLAGLALI